MDEEPYIDEEKDLKPCPFCGGAAGVSKGSKANDLPWWYIECDDCAAMCDSVEEWNKRTPADALSRSRDEALEDACIKADNEIWKVSPECWVSLIQRDELRIRVMDAIRALKIAAPQDSRGNQHSGVPGNVPGNPSASNARSDGLPAEAATVVVPSGELWKRFELSLDGDHACALLGPDLQSGEAEFVKIEGWPKATYKQEHAAMSAAYEALAKRIGARLPFDIVREHAAAQGEKP